ncbi:MAG: UDP-N-acetylglucosamine 2-epimerase, partial [Patescibacteria group bacterium]
DSLMSEPRLGKAELYKKFNISPSEKLVVCLFHPIHLRPDTAGEEMRNVLQALKKVGVQSIVIFPNNDAGNQKVIAQIQKYARLSFIRAFPSLPHEDYVNLLRHADVFVGNSSGGIIETPTLKIPFVNIGDRQKARERSTNVIDVLPRQREIAKAIEKSLYDKRFISRVKQCVSPYGTGGASKKIVSLLESVRLDSALLAKSVTY